MIKKVFRYLFPDHSLVFRIVFKLFTFKYWYPGKWQTDIIRQYFTFRKSGTLIQVGSNNGVTGDPLFKHLIQNEWNGILVEPVPYLFEELCSNYNALSNRFVFENSAIANQCGPMTFYRLKKTNKPGMPVWYDQLGSFRKEVILRQRTVIPYFDELLMEDTVKAITFEELIARHSVKEIQLIHIDTEGFDYEVIKLIPFDRFNIEILMYEHVHLTNIDYHSSIISLKRMGYVVRRYQTDTIAIKQGILKLLKQSVYG